MPSDTLAPQEIDAGDDIHALLNAAFDEHEDKPEVAEKPEPQEAEPPARAPDGKFAKAETPDAEDPPERAAAKVEEKPAETTEEKPAAVASEPPSTWKPEDKETFKTLPPEAQQILLRRHGEMEAYFSKRSQERAAFDRDYEPVRQILSPFETQIRAKGFTPASLIQAWSNVELALTNPENAPRVIADIAKNYNIDRAALGRALGFTTAAAPVEGQPPVDGAAPIQLPPELVQELRLLREKQQFFDQHLTAQQQREQSEAETRVMSTIAAFRDAVDEKGTPTHPHYDELEDDMIELLKVARASGKEPGLQDLYDKAVWANTSTREKVLASQRAAEEAQREADRNAEEARRKAAEEKTRVEARAKAERAKKAASSVTGAPGSGQARMQAAKDGDLSLKDQLLASYDELADA